jgi:DNA-binding MarR family transcriptional regulator
MASTDQTTETPSQTPWYADVVLPVLLAAARKTYGQAIATRLAESGFEDMPRQGSRVVGGIARNGSNLTDFSRVLGVSKQAASQLVDTLVTRGYVERVPHPEDRRRMTVDLTERGRAAAREINAAVTGVDTALAAAVGDQDLARTRAVLGELVRLGNDPHLA